MEASRRPLARWLPLLVFVLVAVAVTIWASGILTPPPPPDPAGGVPAEVSANWVQAAVFGVFAGVVGGTLAWVVVRYPRR
jgi:H+/Cl- antiporter ClcA